MAVLYAGLTIFFGLHFYSILRSRNGEHDIKRKIGEAKYMGLYSVGSAIGLGLIIWGYMLAPASPYLFDGFGNSRTLKISLMVTAFILLVASQLPTGNIKQAVKHPMLLGVVLWAIAHLFDGANLKQVALFLPFLIYSIAAAVSASSRDSKSPNTAGIASLVKFDLLAIVLGIFAFYATVKWLHSGIANFI